MSLGNSLFNARKKSGLSQEEVAEKLGVSRQTISKWELDETLPDIRQAKKLSSLYHLSLDELIDYDMEVEEIERAIEKTSEATQQKIDWNAVWGKKYPVLTTYRQTVAVEDYAARLQELLESLKNRRLQRPGCHAGAQRHFGAGLEKAVTKKRGFHSSFSLLPPVRTVHPCTPIFFWDWQPLQPLDMQALRESMAKPCSAPRVTFPTRGNHQRCAKGCRPWTLLSQSFRPLWCCAALAPGLFFATTKDRFATLS